MPPPDEEIPKREFSDPVAKTPPPRERSFVVCCVEVHALIFSISGRRELVLDSAHWIGRPQTVESLLK
jgi:hypothetical protein